MRAILIAATALTVLSIPAHAEVDHMALTYPACVTTFHLGEADALMRAGKPMNPDVCIMLTESTEIVRVGYTYDYAYMQIAYQQGGQTYTLFTNPSAMKGVASEMRIAKEQAKQKDDERNRKQWADLAEWQAAREDAALLDHKYQTCVLDRALGYEHPICKGLALAVEDKRRAMFDVGHH